MEIFLSHKSALEYWRLQGNVNTADFVMQRRKCLPTSHPNIATIRDMVPSGLTSPINLMICSRTARRYSKTVQSRLHTGPTPDECFVSIGNGLNVSAPPFCLFQMAGELPLVKLIELGFEFCGSYSLPAISEYSHGSEYEDTDKTLYDCPQLTNIEALNNFKSLMKGVNGQKKANRALCYIADGSASPMETIIIMLLTLPYKLGGFGLPMPELNKHIAPRNAIKGGAGERSSRIPDYKCDLYWPKAKLAIEYDSDFYHTGADRIARDSKRRFDLMTLGITVVSVTSRQIRNRVEFENLARLIARKLDKRLRYNNLQFSKTNRELRDLLL